MCLVAILVKQMNHTKNEPELRLFIAADVSDDQRAATIELMENLQKGIAFTTSHPRWVQHDGLHLTLKFLGNVAEKRLKKLIPTVEKKLVGIPAFEFGLKGLGTFPDERKPKVLWLGVGKGKNRMIELAKEVDYALHTIGFERERRPFHPHLTLARIRAMRGVEAMMDVVHSHKRAETVRAVLDRVTLYKSDITPQGALYTALHHWSLKKEKDPEGDPSTC